MPKVHIVGNPWLYKEMFEKYQWQVVDEPALADLIQFTGGEDVSPELYGELPHHSTNNNLARDKREMILYKIARGWGIPMAGICRGGQFLNVMCGGRLYQDVDNHANGAHSAFDVDTKKMIRVTSTHHQMMIPGDKGKVVLKAGESRKCRWRPKGTTVVRTKWNPKKHNEDVEAVFYPEDKVFCFQPHPEFRDQEVLSAYYIYSLYKYLLESKRN